MLFRSIDVHCSNSSKFFCYCFTVAPIDVHCSLKQKIYIYFIQPDLIVSIFYSFYQIRSFIHSDSHSLSFISHSSQAPLSQRRRHHQAHSGTVQLASFFFLFFHFIKSGLIHCHLSSQASQAHSLDIAAIVKFTPVSQAHSLNVAGPTIVNITAIVKFRPTSPICLRRTSLPPIHFRSIVSVFFM